MSNEQSNCANKRISSFIDAGFSPKGSSSRQLDFVGQDSTTPAEANGSEDEEAFSVDEEVDLDAVEVDDDEEFSRNGLRKDVPKKPSKPQGTRPIGRASEAFYR